MESIARDDSHDEEEMPAPGGPTGSGGGPHPRCSPELVVKAQLGALSRGDVVGAASFNLWSRSTSVGGCVAGAVGRGAWGGHGWVACVGEPAMEWDGREPVCRFGCDGRVRRAANC